MTTATTEPQPAIFNVGGPLQARPIPRPNLADAAEDRLRTLIMERVLRPGELLDVRELAESLQISRTPLLTAIDRLEIDGLVDRRGRHNARFIVAESTPDEAEAAQQALRDLMSNIVAPADRAAADALDALSAEPDGARTNQVRHQLAAICDRAENRALAETIRRSLDGLIHLAVHPHAHATFDAEHIA